jgi:hypothetical protein
MRKAGLCLIAASAAMTLAGPAAGRDRAVSRFAVTYAGTGSWHTAYRSTSPNPGGKPDHNRAGDSSAQRWSLTYKQELTLGKCRGRRCAKLQSLTLATGATSSTGRVAHRHVDGLFRADNASEHCKVAAASPAHAVLNAEVSVAYRPGKGIALTALDPVIEAVNLVPGQCPGQGDPIDGLNDNYFTPGFSFSMRYGPERWFKSTTVVIPLGRLRRAKLVRIKLADTRAGTPPKHCAVPYSYQHCTTGGSWHGTLTLRSAKR